MTALMLLFSENLVRRSQIFVVSARNYFGCFSSAASEHDVGGEIIEHLKLLFLIISGHSYDVEK